MNQGLLDVLTLLAQGVGVGAVLAFLFEHVGWFQQMKPDARWWIIFGLSLGMPIAAQLAVQLIPASVWAMLEPYWQALVAGFLVWAGSQGTHKLFNQYLGDGRPESWEMRHD